MNEEENEDWQQEEGLLRKNKEKNIVVCQKEIVKRRIMIGR